MKARLFLLNAAAIVALSSNATKVQVTMNTVSTTMTFESVTTGRQVETGSPNAKVYSFEAPAGDYVISGYGTDGTTLNGTIKVSVPESAEQQEYKIFTCTAYATNTGWSIDNGDYTIDVTVKSNGGQTQEITMGNSTTAGRKTFLVLSGNSYQAALIPSVEHMAENYVTLYKSGTVTFNSNVNGEIPLGENYTVTVPAGANLQLGMKFSHFVDFTTVEPVSVVEKGDSKEITYFLAQRQVYNYRTWIDGGITMAGSFNMGTDPAKRPVLSFTKADYAAYDPHAINHEVSSNKGYETGDIFVNINERGHLVLKQGDSFKAHAMRSWELTDGITSNYFFEPDFHYTVLDIDGKPCSDVIEITGTVGSAWADVKAVGNGTAIVLVTYDGMVTNTYNSAGVKQEIVGGGYWGAIWPENTAVFVVTVGAAASAIEPNMVINDSYNKTSTKVSGDYVDAEHDQFYYLDTDEGAYYTFTPYGADEVTIAYPTIGESAISFSGFSDEGVLKHDDGSYTLLLKQGRQIVRLTDASGNSVYQVLTARECHRDITNVTTPGSDKFYPGDQVLIQYSGLRHPSNKLAGIYNMSAVLKYNEIPADITFTAAKADQYTFANSPAAQAVTVAIPADYDAVANPEVVIGDGMILVSGYGDPIGNHRIIDPLAGRSPNFTAIAHNTLFGSVPEIRIPVSAKGDESSVDQITSGQAEPVMYYNAQGIASATPFRGLNIVRMSDGTVRKLHIAQ